MDSSKTPIVAETFRDVEMFQHCEQCGRCSSACPITDVDGFNIRRLLRFVELDLIDEIAESTMPWSCTTCGRCEDACPHGIKILDIVRGLRARSPDERVPQAGAPCIDACPAGIDVPGYLRLISQGSYEDACALIMEKAPLPGVLGRVCNRPCETACIRGRVNEPVAICAAKRYAADKAETLPGSIFETEADTGRKIAVIGSGPAGLTAAFFLRKKGHRVTVFEARPKPGGMMRYGIPSYRLPEKVLDEEVNRLLSVGIELRTDQKLGENLDAAKLREEQFDAVFIAVGAQSSKKIAVEGSGGKDVLWGLEFLFHANQGKPVEVKDNVVVIGGGSVAIDVAMTAKRLGARRVVMVCLESRDEMPAHPWEVNTAEEEGIEVLNSWGPHRITGGKDKISGIELVRCVSVFDEQGNFAPVFDDTKRSLDTDQIILAVGQTADLEFCRDFGYAADAKEIPVNADLISIDADTQETEVAGVFAGGDVVAGPNTLIHAIAAGQRAAIHIDLYLGGDGVISPSHRRTAAAESYDGTRVHGFADLKRTEPPTLDVGERHKGFAEVDLCFSDEQAKAEVDRCFHCDLEHCLAIESKFG